VATEAAQVEGSPGIDRGPDVALDFDVAAEIRLTEAIRAGRP
jgi:hypothetical protein